MTVSPDPAALIRAETGSKLRSFLYELSEGTANYRTVHSLTEQVQHQYHGRFAIELIQNAYDALRRDPQAGTSQGRIALRLVMDRPAGTLYVANDGAPFSNSNFRSISRLGQSDKNPEVSIGNKGIGFRSVLEISRQPQVWSRHGTASAGFDGYCFGFDPDLVTSLHAPILALLQRHECPARSSWVYEMVDWQDPLIERLRAGIARQALSEGQSEEDWLRHQIGYLSPYLMPWPLAPTARNDTVAEFEADGFATVVALPLSTPSTTALVSRKLAALDEHSVLFLDRLTALSVIVPGQSRTFLRNTLRTMAGPRQQAEISIGSRECPRQFRTWRRTLAVADMPSPVRESLAALPGHWPELTRAEITIAVGSASQAGPGRLSIFLPTQLDSGAGLHINAPFFGDMSRTAVSFAEDADDLQAGGPYNSHLLRQAAELALDAILGDLEGGGVAEAGAILDILSPAAHVPEAAERWQTHLKAAAEARGIEIPEARWMLSDRGWSALVETSLLPLADAPAVLDGERLRRHAAFPAYAAALDSRSAQIRALSDSHGINVYPLTDDVAETIEAAAEGLVAEPQADWAGFWQDVCEMLDDNLSALQERQVLLCTDGALHAGGIEGRAVFFRPRPSADDDGDADEPAIDQIPDALQAFIAILDPAVPVTETREGRRQNTRLHGLLMQAGLVDQFRREKVLADVLIPNMPQLPVQHRAPECAFCRDALVYALRLAQSAEQRGEGQGLLRALARLPVPCRAGWFRLSSALFSAGWPRTAGQTVGSYLRLAGTGSARQSRDRMLRPPEHPDWGRLGTTITELLRRAGVGDGLRLLTIGGETPAVVIDSAHRRFQLPPDAPEPIDPQTWQAFAAQFVGLTSQYRYGRFVLDRLYWLPGLERYSEFDDATRKAFFETVLHSAAGWPAGWDSAVFHRISGKAEIVDVPSPLRVVLGTLPWIPGESGAPGDWCLPHERWLLPARHNVRARAWTLEHLSPLPPEVTAMVEANPGLESFLRRVGVPVYEPDRPGGDPRLLDRMAEAARCQLYRNKDVFVGHLRAAWDAFVPAEPARFPTEIVVQHPDGHLAAHRPSQNEPVYLPGERTPTAALRDLGLPAVVIEPRAARRLAEGFARVYGDALRNAEQFEMIALTGAQRWNGKGAQPLASFSALDGVAPFLLTIAAHHGSNAQGTASASFAEMLRALREAQVAVLPELSMVPMIGAEQVAPSRRETAAWLSRQRTLVLDADWETDIEAVADALTHLLGRSDLRFQNRKGLSEIWQRDEGEALDDILRQLDLTGEHYGGVLELWREDLGPVIERLAILLRLLDRPDLATRIRKAEQRGQLLPLLRMGLPTQADADALLRAAASTRDMIAFGSALRRMFGARVEMDAWNRELARLGAPTLTNPAVAAQFHGHRERALPALRRIVASLALGSSSPRYADAMQMIDQLRCPDALARSHWEVPIAEFARAAGDALIAEGFPEALRAILGQLDANGRLPDRVAAEHGIIVADPVEIAAGNRRQIASVLDQLRPIFAASQANSGMAGAASWIAEFAPDPALAAELADRDFHTRPWDERRCLAFLSAALPEVASHTLRTALDRAESLDGLLRSLDLRPDQLRTAEQSLALKQAEDARRKREVEVCGAPIEASVNGLANLFQHISAQIGEEELDAMPGFDLAAALVPQKLARRHATGERAPGTRSRAPRRHSRSMEDLIGAAGEIHAFRWLQHRYGTEVISPSSWVSAYSLHAFPDNAVHVDEGRGCDLVFTVDGCSFEIEVKSSEGDANSFLLGSSGSCREGGGNLRAA